MDQILYEAKDGVAVITLNRPEVANAQTMALLDDLDAAWTRAAADAEVKVIVLRGNGRHFSSGHDLTDRWPAPKEITLEWIYNAETRRYLEYTLRWRNIPKPSIAAVQGKCIAAGLMLCWPCDLIVAADNAEFSDPVLFMGICGVELHAHTWEFGPRKAKELLFTGGAINAVEAEKLGMVNKVVPLDDLVSATMEMAHKIATADAFALRMAKRAVNHTLDIQGYSTAIDSIFDMHHFGHTRARVLTGGMPSLAGLSSMKEKGKSS
jgi:enoyl-CoA hydratase/carnithine racemase